MASTVRGPRPEPGVHLPPLTVSASVVRRRLFAGLLSAGALLASAAAPVSLLAAELTLWHTFPADSAQEQLLAEAEQAKTEAKGEKEPVRPH